MIVALFLAAALASQSAPVPATTSAPDTRAAASAPTPSSPFEAAPVDAEELDSERGGDGQTYAYTQQTLRAVNSGNRVEGDSVVSGNITTGAGAFTGFDGLGNFIMNTGHNNNLQSTMSVTVVTTPSGQ